jgi:DNA-binding transcriptional regulator LsrR (DeoR family)
MNKYSHRAFAGLSGVAGNGGPLPLGPPARTVPARQEPVKTCALRDGTQTRLIARVARLYHQGSLTQREIAARLHLSQGTVCRMLQKAEEHGIVRVTVTPPEGTFVDLEELLERKFGLAQVVIARAASDSEESVQSALGAAAAHFLETTLRPREIIGVDAGSAASWAMVERMRPVWKVADCQVVQVLGGVGDPTTEKNSHHLMAQLADLVLGEARFLPVPCVVDSKQAADVLAQDPHLRETMALFDRITVALVGIGSLEPASWFVGSGNHFSVEDLQALQATGVVGHVCLRFYDTHGQEVEGPRGARVVFGLESARLKSIPRVVGIAGGKRKHQAILGALRGHWINALITEQYSAEALLRA